MSEIFKLLFTRLVLPPASAFEGKTVLVTGANTGLGRETVRHMVRLGAKTVIMGVRTVARGEEAKKSILESVPSSKAELHVWPIDLESFASVQSFATRVRKFVADQKDSRLDVAVMNAGLATGQFVQTVDGFEKSLQINDLSTALLSLYLLPVLVETKRQHPSTTPHLVVVASDVHEVAHFAERQVPGSILEALNDESQWAKSQKAGAIERYALTKLLDLYLVQQLAKLVPSSENTPSVVINGPTPGFCKSELLSREKGPVILRIIQMLVARTVEEGSKTLVYAAAAGTESHGQYLNHQAVATVGKLAKGPDADAVREKLWSEIVDVLRKFDPEVPLEFA